MSLVLNCTTTSPDGSELVAPAGTTSPSSPNIGAGKLYFNTSTGKFVIGKDNDNLVTMVDEESAQTIAGLKTFSTLPQSSAVPSAGDDFVNKTYADSLSGSGGKQEVITHRLVGNGTVAELDVIGSNSVGIYSEHGRSYVVTDSGTLANGSIAVNAGDIVEWWIYDGYGPYDAWKLVHDSGTGFPADGSVVILDSEGALIAPYTDSTDNGKLAEFDGASLTAAILTNPNESDEALVNTIQATAYRNVFRYTGSVPTGVWYLADDSLMTFDDGGPVNIFRPFLGSDLLFIESGNTYQDYPNDNNLQISSSGVFLDGESCSISFSNSASLILPHDEPSDAGAIWYSSSVNKIGFRDSGISATRYLTKKHVATFSSQSSVVVNHFLYSDDLVIQAWDGSTPLTITSVTFTSIHSCTVNFGSTVSGKIIVLG